MNITTTLPSCRLRALEPSDIELIYLWENDPEVWRVGGTTAPLSYQRIAQFVEEQNYDLAEELVYEFADKNSPQQMWLARSFLLLGDIYVARDNLFQARATYQSIVDGYTSHDDGIVAAAKERVEALLEKAEEPTTK